jgi:hypothetical protein
MAIEGVVAGQVYLRHAAVAQELDQRVAITEDQSLHEGHSIRIPLACFSDGRNGRSTNVAGGSL